MEEFPPVEVHERMPQIPRPPSNQSGRTPRPHGRSSQATPPRTPFPSQRGTPVGSERRPTPWYNLRTACLVRHSADDNRAFLRTAGGQGPAWPDTNPIVAAAIAT
ncbi:hypothetical protein GCM10027089_45140 [Nocardia thraciensis]